MTPNDIRIDAQVMSGMKIDNNTNLIWIKDAIIDIATKHPFIMPREVEEVKTDKEYTSFALAYEPVLMDKVLRNKPSRCYDSRWEMDGKQKILLYAKGDYTIIYHRLPDLPETADSEIDLPTPFLSALKFYSAARLRARIAGQDDNSATSFMNEYTSALRTAVASSQRLTKRHRRMPPFPGKGGYI